jgi:hypothetical protein
MPDWKNIVRTVAPTLAAALGGPLAGVAVQALSVALLGKPDGTEDEVAVAVATGGVDALVKIKEAEHAFAIRMRELDIDLEKIIAADRASARDLAKIDFQTPRMLAIGITIGFFGILSWLLGEGFPDTGKEPLLIMLGSLGTAWGGIVSFYFGSTAGSARKTEALERLIVTK